MAWTNNEAMQMMMIMLADDNNTSAAAEMMVGKLGRGRFSANGRSILWDIDSP